MAGHPRPRSRAASSGVLVAAADRWPALREDLMTDWVPDAVGGAGVDPAAVEDASGPPQVIEVATASGRPRVPLAPVGLRVRGHLAAEASLPPLEACLPSSVCGYRDAATPYRVEWQRWLGLLRGMADGGGTVLRADVRSFFTEVSTEAVRRTVPWEMAGFCDDVRRLHGQFLLPGHRWARRVANLVLAPVDDRIAVPFARWQDDYALLVPDPDGAETAAAALDHALAGVGLRHNLGKSRVVAARELRAGAAPSAPDWSRARSDRDVPAMKRLLRAAAQGRSAGPRLDTALVEEFPTLLPRICWLLSIREGNPGAADLIGGLVASTDDWTAARAMAAAAGRPGLAAAVSPAHLQRHAASGLAPVRALAARLLHDRGLDWPTSLPHVDRALAASSRSGLGAFLPVVETTL
jgi:hypothetical protein